MMNLINMDRTQRELTNLKPLKSTC